MKISYNWLKQYLAFDISPEEVSTYLTDCGLEVESVTGFSSVIGGLKDLVIGEVLEKTQHPNADKLSLTKVTIGAATPLSIVCGAPNVAAGQKVVVAPVGATIFPINSEPFTLKKAKIRGEDSEGMICAEDEIGLGNSHDGIMILDAKAQVGMQASTYFNIENDVIFEIGLTPNRADAASHYGVARDLKAVLKTFHPQKYNSLQLRLPSVQHFTASNKEQIEVIVEDFDACPRYAGVLVSGLSVKNSPDWLQNRLKAIGLKPINNLVDITNYILHECGNPLHAFDADKIKGNKVIVKSGFNAVDFTCLDEQIRKLHTDDLMICNAEEPMCIAGVFGGLHSGVSEKTTRIFIESAYFNPVSVRKTAKRHGLSTDASFRFERGVDPNNILYALQRAALLMCELGGGYISSPVYDLYPNPIKDTEIEFSYANCDKLIGKKIDRNIIKSILQELEIKIVKESTEGLSLQIPPFKTDVTREADVIEEILRVYGYNQVEIPEKMNFSLSFSKGVDLEKLQETTADLLVASGFTESMHNSLTKESYYSSDTDVVKLLNPLSQDLGVLRKNIVYQHLEAINYNLNRRIESVKIFEFGTCYSQNEESFYEDTRLCISSCGFKTDENWTAAQQAADFYYIKSIIDKVLIRIGLYNKISISELESDTTLFQQGFEYHIGKTLIARFGKVKTQLLKQFDIKKDVYSGEIYWSKLSSFVTQVKTKFKELPKFPYVRRDLALLVDNNISFDSIKSIAEKSAKALLKEVNLFDVYEGKNLPEGKKSYAVSFIFRDDSKTLTDQEIEKQMETLINLYAKDLGASLR
jgi:phenylalanyl-tRNA synthetase beta chain